MPVESGEASSGIIIVASLPGQISNQWVADANKDFIISRIDLFLLSIRIFLLIKFKFTECQKIEKLDLFNSISFAEKTKNFSFQVCQTQTMYLRVKFERQFFLGELKKRKI